MSGRLRFMWSSWDIHRPQHGPEEGRNYAGVRNRPELTSRGVPVTFSKSPLKSSCLSAHFLPSRGNSYGEALRGLCHGNEHVGLSKTVASMMHSNLLEINFAVLHRGINCSSFRTFLGQRTFSANQESKTRLTGHPKSD